MNKIILISILAIVLMGGFLIFYNPKPENWESKNDNQATVSITVTPIDISSQSKEWKFDIVMDTHSVELDQDMTEFAVLIDDQDKEYKPISWEGPSGGHHREGALVFNPIEPTPKYIELKIKNIGGVNERLFKWNIE
ncbi:MAG: hypothetical protein UW97_C0009G0006 [Parcubacteria group bacterium GW2011_GWA2_45_15]|nr:MAG: hypothetical protein UW97_C0009G0006 [Parcubacteria group bacterium GW2011_GWA2_45_15]